MTGIVPITLLTGFLGAGKTTLINRLLAVPGEGTTAVVVNELSETGLDHSLIAAVHGQVVEMTTGCLCCSAGGDIGHALLDLARRAEHYEINPFDRVVIETTGVADPAPLVPMLMLDARLTARFRLASIVTALDVLLGASHLARYEEARRQVRLADRVLLTKTDLALDPASKAEIAELRAEVETLNPTAETLDAHAADLDLAACFRSDPMSRGAGRAAAWLAVRGAVSETGSRTARRPGSTHASTVAATAFAWSEPLDQAALLAALSGLLARHTPKVLRVKGVIACRPNPEQPLVVHAVGPYLSPPSQLARWPDEDRTSRLVVIADGLPEAEIRAALASLDTASTPQPSRSAAR